MELLKFGDGRQIVVQQHGMEGGRRCRNVGRWVLPPAEALVLRMHSDWTIVTSGFPRILAAMGPGVPGSDHDIRLVANDQGLKGTCVAVRTNSSSGAPNMAAK